jgi:hypothetical protein
MRRSAAEIAVQVRPVTLAAERMLPVLPALRSLMPDAEGLRRGTTVSVGGGSGTGATSLAMALLAGAVRDGSWAAVAGLPTMGLAAAAGFGVALQRLVLVAEPPAATWATVVATLVDAFDLVLARTPGRVRTGDARRLAARARERGSVLIVLADSWEGAELRLTVVDAVWEGLEAGHGHLRARRVTVETGGRRRADRPHLVDLWLPDPDGGVSVAEPLATVHPLPSPRLEEIGSTYAPYFLESRAEEIGSGTRAVFPRATS